MQCFLELDFFPNIPISHIFGKYMVELALAPIQDG